MFLPWKNNKASVMEALLFQQFREHWRLIAG